MVPNYLRDFITLLNFHHSVSTPLFVLAATSITSSEMEVGGRFRKVNR
jgi:hypothetical protein